MDLLIAFALSLAAVGLLSAICLLCGYAMVRGFEKALDVFDEQVDWDH